MDIDNITQSKEPMSFINYLLTLDEDNKIDLLNIIQYTVLAIIPIILILKAVKHFVPEEDESKGNLEILLESVGQIIFMLMGLWFTDRIIRYFGTYSGKEYQAFNSITFILPFLLILSTMQTKLGSKINILIERTMDLINGNNEAKENVKQEKNVKVSQPIAGQHQPSQSDTLDTSQLLPSNRGLTSIPQQNTNNTDFNDMYQNTSNPQTIYIRLENEICFTTSSFEIETENCIPFIPEGFSPNNDNINDVFEIDYLLNVYLDYELKIFSRYGNIIYKGTHEDGFWDGISNEGITFKHQLVPTGVYIYVLQLNDYRYPDSFIGTVYINY
mgnify:CR=1 FL=1